MIMEATDFMIYCASADHLTDLTGSLNEGLSVDAQNSQGVTALQAAAAHGHVKIVKFLLEKSASVHITNLCGWTPLMLAARYGYHEIASILLKNKAKVNVTNKLGLTAISAAVWNGDSAMVDLLLDAGASFEPGAVSDAFHIDLSPVMICSFLGHDKILRMLLKKGATVNHLSSITGWSSLMLAACNGYDKTAWTLIQWGVDICIADVCGRNALDISTAQRRSVVTSLLETAITSWNGSQRPPEKSQELIYAVRDGNLTDVKEYLLRDKLTVNSVDKADGFSLLMIASMNGDLDIVKTLVNGGAEIDAQNEKDGWNAIMQAVFFKHMNVVQYLLDNGADVLAETQQGYTVLDIALHLEKSYEDIYFAIRAKVEEVKRIHRSKSNTDGLPSNALTKLLPTGSWRTAKTSSQSSRFKSWFGSKTSRSPNKSSCNESGLATAVPIKSSSKESITCAATPVKSSSVESVVSIALPTVVIDDVDVYDDVFERRLTSAKVGKRKLMKPISSLCSPERYLANSLRKHSMMEEEIILDDPEDLDIGEEFMFSLKDPPKDSVLNLKKPNFRKKIKPKMWEAERDQKKIFDYCGSSLSDEDDDNMHKYFDDLKLSTSKLKGLDKNYSKSPCSLHLPRDVVSHAHSNSSQSMRKSLSQGSWSSKSPSDLKNANKSPLRKLKPHPKDLMEPDEREVSKGLMEQDCEFPIPSDPRSLSQLIKDDSLQKHVRKLKEQEIDVEIFKDLTEEDLNELQIETVASREKLLKIASNLKSSAFSK